METVKNIVGSGRSFHQVLLSRFKEKSFSTYNSDPTLERYVTFSYMDENTINIDLISGMGVLGIYSTN